MYRIPSRIPRALDPSLYELTPDQKGFLKSQTGIEDDDELKAHVLGVQAKAYKVDPYPCIQRFSFIKPLISRMPAYSQVIRLGRERERALLLDIGCAFGTELRKLVTDGFPVENIIASDLHPEFWELGHDLFNSTSKSFPVVFVPGDALDPFHLAFDLPPLPAPPTTPEPHLSSLTSLNPLQGRVSVIYAGFLLHFFAEEKELQVARALASLLSPLPGSIILGGQIGRFQKGRVESEGYDTLIHSPKSWQEFWDGTVFEKGTVTVYCGLRELPWRSPDGDVQYLYWSVTRK